MSPENLIPPSATIPISRSLRTSLMSRIADICGTPIPAIIRVVQIEPGPMPTLIASAPAFTNSIAPSEVATLPAIKSIEGNSFLIIFTVSMTFFECP